MYFLQLLGVRQLATVLWLTALRRENENIGARQFLKAGLLAMPPALFPATIAVSVSSK